MLFKKSKDNLMKETVIISCANQVLFEGLLKEIPLLEEIIIQKSIHFFDDAEPCEIHRSAVRLRLLAEIEKELLEDKWLCLIQYTPFTDITDVKFSK